MICPGCRGKCIVFRYIATGVLRVPDELDGTLALHYEPMPRQDCDGSGVRNKQAQLVGGPSSPSSG
jgi:hypothetical protein